MQIAKLDILSLDLIATMYIFLKMKLEIIIIQRKRERGFAHRERFFLFCLIHFVVSIALIPSLIGKANNLCSENTHTQKQREREY